MEGSSSKKYGLIIPKKKVPSQSLKKPSAFAESSSEDEGEEKKLKMSSLWRENKKNAKTVESRGEVLKALKEDPSVFEYDAIYDQMQEKKIKSNPRLASKDRNSKYIAKLKKVADRRKLEQEIIYERKVQRDMEREGKQSEDQDTYLTSAYRKKLEERRKLEEELKIEAHMEEAEDVTKQKDMTRFHRTLLSQIADDGGSKKELGKQEQRRNSEREDIVGSLHGVSSSRPGEEVGQSRMAGKASESTEESSPEPEARQVVAEDEPSSGTSPGTSPIPVPVDLEEQDIKKGAVEEGPSELSKEEKRKTLTAKRTSEASLSSAKERYLARKRAKMCAPVLSTDD